MAAVNSWKYARWVYIIGRSLRINGPNRGERAAVRAYLTSELSQRPYLRAKLQQRSGRWGLDIPNEYDYNLALMVMCVGRWLKKIPMVSAEKTLADTLITATGNRRLGYRGGPAGSIVG